MNYAPVSLVKGVFEGGTFRQLKNVENILDFIIFYIYLGWKGDNDPKLTNSHTSIFEMKKIKYQI